MSTSESINQIYADLRHEFDMPFQFFFAFGRFEYALKNAGFLTSTDGPASADWGRFADSCPDLTESRDPRLKACVEYLFNNPPKKQVCVGGVLQFIDAPPTQRSNQQLCVLLRRIRNNLFHGAKFPYDADRDGKLISAAMCILEALLNSSSKIRQWFE